MAASKVAIRYASSFLDTAIEKNLLDKVSQDFDLIYKTLNQSADLRRAIKSPIIKKETKQSIFAAVFKDKINDETFSYLDFVIGKGREEILQEILEKFFYLRDEYLGIANVHVITAFNLSSEQKEQLKQRFELILRKQIVLTYSVDEKIIGGFVAKVGDTIYNASVLHQLDLLKKQFLHGSVYLN
jgi:F-type H+-transporting ATPase subunit delta